MILSNGRSVVIIKKCLQHNLGPKVIDVDEVKALRLFYLTVALRAFEHYLEGHFMEFDPIGGENACQTRYIIPTYSHVASAYGAALGGTSVTIDTIVSLDQQEKVLTEIQQQVLKAAGNGSRLVDV